MCIALILAALIQHDSRFKLKVFLCWHFTWPEGNSRHGDRMDWVVIMTLVEVGLSRPGALIDMERLQIGGFAFPWSFLPSIHCSKSFEEGASCSCQLYMSWQMGDHVSSSSEESEESETREMLFVRSRSLTFGTNLEHSQFSMMWLVMVEFEAHCVQFWY